MKWGLISVFLLVVVAGAVLYVVSANDSPQTYQLSEKYNLRFVSGTEYVPGQEGQVIIEIRDDANDIVYLDCNALIWYANKTLFLNETMIDDTTTESQYINFTVSDVEGVYEYQAECWYDGDKYVDSKSFHVTDENLVNLTPVIDDIRSLVSFTEMGVDEVQLGDDARNGWRIESPFLTDIVDVSCRIYPVDEDRRVIDSEDFTDGYADTWTFTGVLSSPPYLATTAGGWTLPGVNIYSNVGFPSAATAGGYVEKMVDFMPKMLYAKMTPQYIAAWNPNQVSYIGLYYYNSSDDLVGKTYVYIKHTDGTPFPATGCDPDQSGIPQVLYPLPDDSCVLGIECPNMRSCSVEEATVDMGIMLTTHCGYGNVTNAQTSEVTRNSCVAIKAQSNDFGSYYSIPVSEKEATIEVNLYELINNSMDISSITKTKIRYANQNDVESIYTSAQYIIVLSEPIGTEYMNSTEHLFGLNWKATRFTTTSWTDYTVKCGIVYDADGIRAADGLEQFVFVSNHNKLKAYVVK